MNQSTIRYTEAYCCTFYLVLRKDTQHKTQQVKTQPTNTHAHRGDIYIYIYI
jgi:hypothetical protein